MRVKRDEANLLKIHKLENIESIEIKDIYQSLANGKSYIVPGFMVVYGNPVDIIYMNTQDKYFEDFVSRLREVYLTEKDNVIDNGILGKKYIQIDPLSKDLLLNGGLEHLDEFYSLYEGKQGYDESLSFECDLLKSMFPIFKYHLKETLANLGLTLTYCKLSEGINGVYWVNVMIDMIPKNLPIYYTHDEFSHSLEIGNITDNAMPLKIDLTFNNESINIHSHFSEYNYSDYTSYLVKNSIPYKEREVYKDNRLVHWESNPLPISDGVIPGIWSTLEQINNMVWYQLPCGSFYGISTTDKCIEGFGKYTDSDGEHRMITNEHCLVIPTEDNVFMNDIITKKYVKRIDDRTIPLGITLDKVSETSIGIIKPEGVLFERHFADTSPNGYYKKHLANKYFYQVYDNSLSKENMLFLSRKEGIQEPSDLLEPKIYTRGK